MICYAFINNLILIINVIGFNKIYEWCKEGLDAGKHVIRLKIGDPFVFGRGGEEVLKFREFGVEPKVIPVSLLACHVSY